MNQTSKNHDRKGLFFNIQRYSLHDGAGIRTILFFKGCPLSCPWCCNPESQSFEREQAKIPTLCIHCPTCSRDVGECPSGAMVQFGKVMTVAEVLQEVKKDMIFYHTSGGGVTLSGGEVLGQFEFAMELLQALSLMGVNTALETCGQGCEAHLLKLAQYTDLVLFDLKIMEEEQARDVLSADIHLIKKNLTALSKTHSNVVVRFPLIPGYTMGAKNIEAILEFVKALKLTEIHLLPFHQYGSSKYETLHREYLLKESKPPLEKEVNFIKEKMEKAGLHIVVGGL